VYLIITIESIKKGIQYLYNIYPERSIELRWIESRLNAPWQQIQINDAEGKLMEKVSVFLWVLEWGPRSESRDYGYKNWGGQHPSY